MKTRIDVVVPQFNHGEKTNTLLSSILEHYGEGHPSLDVKVILVDNGSEFPFLTRREKLRTPSIPDPVRLVIRNSRNLGFVRGTNQGVCAADAPFVVMQNNDTEVYPGLYEAMLDAFQRGPQVMAVGPVVSETEHSWQSWDRLQTKGILGLGEESLKLFRSFDHQQRATMLGLDLRHGGDIYQVKRMLAFFCTMFRAEVFTKVGLLSTEFGMGLGDDDDFCARIRAAGGELFLCLKAYVRHDGRTTIRDVYQNEELAKARDRALEILRSKYGSDYGTTDPC